MSPPSSALLPKTPLQTLLDSIRSTARNEYEKGQAFEQLCLQYLRIEPEYKTLYQHVERYADWAAQHNLVIQRDIGIDLVATTYVGEYHAIQCKCYLPDQRINKKDIDSFIAAAGDKAFSAALLIDTSEKVLGDNADQALSNQSKLFIRIGLDKLEKSIIDWSHFKINQPNNESDFRLNDDQGQYFVENIDKKPLKNKHKARPYQQKAIDDVLSGLKTTERGKLIMACGTGKTFIALKIAEQQAGVDKTVLFLVPSLALLSQTLTEWIQQSEIPINAFAVCSDSEVGKRRNKQDGDNDAIYMALYELAYPATTNGKQLAAQYIASKQASKQASKL